MARKYWLFKTEPDSFSIDDLINSTDQTTAWDGVRNYQARNLLRDEVQPGDGVLFYHSSVSPPGVAGICTVVRRGYPDKTARDPESDYYDPKSSPDEPRWIAVDVRFEKEFTTPVTLEEMRETAGLEKMMLLQRGSRLSIQPVTPEEWKIIQRLGSRKRKSSK